MSSSQTTSSNLTEPPNDLEKKVDLLLAMLVDEQIWNQNSPPNASYKVLRDVLQKLGFDFTPDPGVIDAIELLHQYGDGSYVLSRREVFDRINRILLQFDKLRDSISSITMEVRESGVRTREAISDIEKRLLTIDMSQKQLLSGKETEDHNTNQLNQTITQMADQYSNLRIEYGELSSTVASLNKLINIIHETLTNMSKDVAQMKDSIRK